MLKWKTKNNNDNNMCFVLLTTRASKLPWTNFWLVIPKFPLSQYIFTFLSKCSKWLEKSCFQKLTDQQIYFYSVIRCIVLQTENVLIRARKEFTKLEKGIRGDTNKKKKTILWRRQLWRHRSEIWEFKSDKSFNSVNTVFLQSIIFWD